MSELLAAIAVLLHRRTLPLPKEATKSAPPAFCRKFPRARFPQSNAEGANTSNPGAAPGGTPDAGAAGQAGPRGRRLGSGTGNAQGGGPGTARNGQAGGSALPTQGGGRRRVPTVGLNGQNQINADSAGEDMNASDAGGQLGQAASADAVQMIGTVAMGQSQNQMEGFLQSGDGGPTGRAHSEAAATQSPDKRPPAISPRAVPGWRIRRWRAGPGGPDGGPVFVMRGGGEGGRGPGGPGPGRPAGVDALWGGQRVMRQRINRVHYSFYDTISEIRRFNARSYSLYQAVHRKFPVGLNPRDSTWAAR